MSKYEIYKPSGIDWIGSFPTHWQFNRLKNVCIVNKEALTEKTPFDYLIEYIDIGNTNDKGEFIEVQEMQFSEAPSRARRRVEEGDTIISTVRTYLRAIAFIEKPKRNLIVSTGFAVLNSNRKRLLPKFLFYQVLCDSFIQRVIANSEGVSYPAISSTKLADLKLFLPSITEQLAIANFLDNQTQKIDRLIANKKAQAEKLKELRQIEINYAVTKGLNPNAEMKDSGIDWLGEIPKHWEVKRLKNILIEKMMYGANEIADEDDETQPRYIRITDFGLNGDLREDTFRSLNYEIAKGYLLQEGDILFARSGATVGKTFRFKNYKGIACFAGYLIKARPNTKIITSDFLFFFTQSNGYENWKNSIFSKATIENIGADKYQLLKLAVPPTIEEQNEITAFLKLRTEAFDNLTKNIASQIQQLQELRKIKIYEAVTGKIKVNGYVEATA